MNTDDVLGLALRWATSGVPAFPIAIRWDDAKHATDKRPLNGHGHRSATTDPEELRGQFARAHPQDGEVLAVGLWPGGADRCVIDVDVKNDAGGDDSLDVLEREHGPLPDGPIVTTASGGWHMWFSKPAGLHISSSHSLGAGIDVRADDGWVVAPGVETPWGAWTHDESTPRQSPLLPDWVLERLNSSNGHRPAGHWKALDRDALDPRDLAALEALEQLGGHSAYRTGDYIAVTRPGNTSGASASIGHIGPGIVKVFTPNWPPLEDGKVYNADQLGTVFDRPPAGSPAGGLLLPDDFWDERGELGHIRDLAHARRVSPDVVLQAVLARVVALTTHQLRLPPIIGTDVALCYYAIALGPSGVGKSGANGAAAELIVAPPEMPFADQVPPGTGEGLTELLFATVEEKDDDGKARRVRKQVRYNAYVYVDEGQTLLAIGGRTGATTFSILRSLWTGGPAGVANATEDRRRVLPARTYVYGLVLGFQDHLAGALLDDVDAGTPQRFMWGYALDPATSDEVPDDPGRFEWAPVGPQLLSPLRVGYRYEVAIPDEVRDEIIADHTARRRGAHVPNPLDSHRMLLREKTAAALMLLARRVEMSVGDWALAGVMLEASDRVRDHALQRASVAAATKEERTTRRLVARARATDVGIRHGRVVEAARKIADKVWAEPGKWTVARMRRVMRGYRDEFVDALEEAAACAWIIEEVAPGQGTDKRLLRPGERKPS